jgi:Rieske Fe-S protein
LATFDTERCLRFSQQARFHPLKYLQGLARTILTKGGVFRPFTAVDEIAQSGGTVTIKTRNGQTILARDVVCATNSPIAGRLTLQAKMAPYRSYAMAFEVPKGSVTDALYWDTLDAYHYVRLQPDEETDTLIVGGEDHKTGEADDAEARFQRLEDWTKEKFGDLGRITHRWSGQVLEPVDFAGYVGRDPDNDRIYFVTADSGQGITNGAVAGMLIPALFDGGDHPWRTLYDPARVTLKSAGTFIAENSTAVKSMAEHLGGPLLDSEEALQPGEGGLVRDGVNVIAVYRDEDGTPHRVSSKCSHVWCTVHFNSFERCWDCPCHGSHFDIHGNELNAPAAFGTHREIAAAHARPIRRLTGARRRNMMSALGGDSRFAERQWRGADTDRLAIQTSCASLPVVMAVITEAQGHRRAPIVSRIVIGVRVGTVIIVGRGGRRHIISVGVWRAGRTVRFLQAGVIRGSVPLLRGVCRMTGIVCADGRTSDQASACPDRRASAGVTARASDEGSQRRAAQRTANGAGGLLMTGGLIWRDKSCTCGRITPTKQIPIGQSGRRSGLGRDIAVG